MRIPFSSIYQYPLLQLNVLDERPVSLRDHYLERYACDVLVPNGMWRSALRFGPSFLSHVQVN